MGDQEEYVARALQLGLSEVGPSITSLLHLRDTGLSVALEELPEHVDLGAAKCLRLCGAFAVDRLLASSSL